MYKPEFHVDILKIKDIELMVNLITTKLKEDVTGTLQRFGGVIGLSGGIDSSVTLVLAARALGPEKIFGVMMPEKESNKNSELLASELANKFGIQTTIEVITGALDGKQCYERRDQAVKEVIPEYNPLIDKMKIGIKIKETNGNLPPLFHLTVIKPDGSEIVKRLPANHMLTIIAASNFKQRTRMSMLYYHAECIHYAVIGTPNKQEVDQGFFVKYGDGGGDVFPIGHLYKSQVYQIAEYLEVPREIIERIPTTDTYSADQTQEEFFFEHPYDILDLLWYAFENKVDPVDAGRVMDMSESEVSTIYMNFERRNKITSYLRRPPINDYYFT